MVLLRESSFLLTSPPSWEVVSNPFVIVVSVCTILTMIATLPVAQLFFFHILLVEKGISTYDYIIALTEQEQSNKELVVNITH
ncbi:probable protein S-acyltransferase 22 [Arachis ipaensis]|uniref:probable protein S-acyltransferase 22 n=1 Tax=Arachis ipaensis TaxID=130454 RepID=UPI000A2B2C26|nr:probable protein S-acyltransferase 22 [Arachis ipaensis]